MKRPPLRRVITKAFHKNKEIFFVRFYNGTEDQTFVMTRIWFECDPPIDIFQERLPITIYPIQGIEPWINVDVIPKEYHAELEKFLRVQLSTEEILLGAKRTGERC